MKVKEEEIYKDPILDTRISVRPSSSARNAQTNPPPLILKWRVLESSGQILISLHGKTKIIFFFGGGGIFSQISDFWTS